MAERPYCVRMARHDMKATIRERDKGPWPPEGGLDWWLRYWATNRARDRRVASMRSAYRYRMIARRRRG